MKVKETQLVGVLEFTPEVFTDHRGEYVETWNQRDYAGLLSAGVEFIQDDYSCSKKDVLRGIHGDAGTWKLVYCPFGQILLAVVNWDADSPEYRQWETFTISAKNHRQILIPPKFGNGHLVRSESAIFAYKQTTYYGELTQFTIPWDSTELQIPWPVMHPILSKRDGG